ncbi:MAG: rhomboid family intramembrane serine protease [Bacteroidaceae bacterium]|nr:rhomboid family intramembrane serine protease [Bacteroidaceae bacterium]
MPTITKNLLIINCLMFFGQIVAEQSGIRLEEWLGLHFWLADHFYPWQFVTYIFLHGGFAHLFFNMFALWMFGSTMERVWGPRRFIVFFLICGMGAGLTQELAQGAKYMVDGMAAYDFVRVGDTVQTMGSALDAWNTVGASGAIFGILLAFGLTFPEERMFVFPIPFPIPAKYFVVGYAALELLMGFGGSKDGVAHFAHLGGMLFGWLLMLYWAGRLKLPEIKNPFRRRTWHAIIDEQPIPGFNSPEEEWNARRREREIEVDRILDKVRKHGYGSLSEREKRVLFNAGGGND